MAVKKAAKKSGDTSLAKEWKRLEKQFSKALGKSSIGAYPAELEPRAMSFEHAFEPSPLLPPDYLQFVKELGYRWVNTGDTALGFLPPRWRLNLSQQMGEPGRPWDVVRSEREAGTHTYGFVMFASRDINDVNGYCFGKSEAGDELVVWNVEDSLPESELGPFSSWLEEEMQAARGAGPAREAEEARSALQSRAALPSSRGGTAPSARIAQSEEHGAHLAPRGTGSARAADVP